MTMTFYHLPLCKAAPVPSFLPTPPSFLQTPITFLPPLALFMGLFGTQSQALIVLVAIPPLHLVHPPLTSYLILDWILVNFTLVF